MRGVWAELQCPSSGTCFGPPPSQSAGRTSSWCCCLDTEENHDSGSDKATEQNITLHVVIGVGQIYTEQNVTLHVVIGVRQSYRTKHHTPCSYRGRTNLY